MAPLPIFGRSATPFLAQPFGTIPSSNAVESEWCLWGRVRRFSGIVISDRERETMSKFYRFLAVLALGLFYVGTAGADTLELKDGRVLKGRYLGGTQVVLRFETNGEVQTFNTTDIVALTFTGNSGHSAPATAPAPPAAAPMNGMASTDPGSPVTIPAGQSLLVRMIDGVDSSKNH